MATLAMKNPGLLRVCSLLRPDRDDRMDVAYDTAIDGSKIRFRYNAKKLATVGVRMAARFLYMECLRVLLGHYDKRKKSDLELCKKASDIVTATYTMQAFPAVPEESADAINLMPTYQRYKNYLIPRGVEYPFKNFTFDDIYGALIDLAEKPDDDEDPDDPSSRAGDGSKQEPVGKPGGAAETNEETDKEGSAPQQDGEVTNEEMDKEDGQGGAGRGPRDDNGELSGEPDEAAGSDSGPGDAAPGSEGQDAAGDGRGPGCDGDSSAEERPEAVVRELFRHIPADGSWDGGDPLDDEIRSLVNDLKVSNQLAAIVGQSLEGEVLGRYKTVVKQLSNSLRKFMASVASTATEETWRRQNRRYDDELPGERTVCQPKVLLAVDCSGSMHIRVDRVVDMLKRLFRMFTIDVCFWNTECTIPVHANLRAVTVPHAFGGTNPQCILEMIAEKHYRYDGIVVVSDCEFMWDRPDCWKKIAIIRVQPSVKFGDEADYSFPEWCRYQVDDSDTGI